MSGENWGYWYFARLFNETGFFSTWDRSPLYVLYFSPFIRLGYPTGVILEYIVTSAIFCASFAALFRRSELATAAAVASVIMLPALWLAAPNCQALGLSCVFLGFASLMSSAPHGQRIAIALFFLTLAYLFRSSFAVALIIVPAYLFLSGYRAGESRARRARMLAVALLPSLIFVALLLGVIRSHQAVHAWNNVFIASAQWFPVNTASLFDSGFVTHLNWIYAAEKYPGEKGIDFFRTNQELFAGAATASQAVMANPGFVAHALWKNALSVFDTLAFLTTIPAVLYKIGVGNRVANTFIGLCIAVAIFYFCRSQRVRVELRVMAACLTLTALTSILSMPKGRYFIPVVPVLFLLCAWALDAVRTSRGTGRLGNVRERFNAAVLGRIGYGTSVWLLFAAISYSTVLLYEAAAAAPKRGFPVLESPAESLKAHHIPLVSLAKGCRGIMTAEHTFFGAFVADRGTRVYDVFEIPPFGEIGATPYRGLHPDRVDCLFISQSLAENPSFATDSFNRHKNYIEPYARELMALGAVRTPIPGYGHAVRLRGN